jgi:hypothetical protein
VNGRADSRRKTDEGSGGAVTSARPPTHQLKIGFQKGAQGGEKEDAGRESSAIRPGAYARQNVSPERSLHTILNNNVSLTPLCIRNYPHGQPQAKGGVL